MAPQGHAFYMILPFTTRDMMEMGSKGEEHGINTTLEEVGVGRIQNTSDLPRQF